MSLPIARDPGMQQERTALAWRRTGLALVVAAVTIGRLTLEALGPVVVVATVIVAVLAGWVVVHALRARRLATRPDGEPAFSVLADGRLPAIVSIVLGTLAVAEVSAAVSRLL